MHSPAHWVTAATPDTTSNAARAATDDSTASWRCKLMGSCRFSEGAMATPASVLVPSGAKRVPLTLVVHWTLHFCSRGNRTVRPGAGPSMRKTAQSAEKRLPPSPTQHLTGKRCLLRLQFAVHRRIPPVSVGTSSPWDHAWDAVRTSPPAEACGLEWQPPTDGRLFGGSLQRGKPSSSAILPLDEFRGGRGSLASANEHWFPVRTRHVPLNR